MAQDEQRDIPFSSNDVFEDLTDKDKTVEISGYICSLKAAATVGEGGRYKLLKFSLTNGTKKVQCCIWGQALIDIYEADILMYKKVHIDGAHCKISRISYAMEKEGYVSFDLTIQASTTLTFHGMFESNEAGVQEVVPQVATFDTINQMEGLVSIEGYIKTKFTAIPSRFERATYGCGSITNGTHKITINVTNFVPTDDFQKGVPVTVVGTINYDGLLSISCNSMTSITVRENTPPMPDAELLQAGKTFRRRDHD